MKTLIAALALTALPTLAHAIPPCRIAPRASVCTIDSAADQRALPPPNPAGRVPAPPLPPGWLNYWGMPTPMAVLNPPPPKVHNNIFVGVPVK